MSRLQPLHGLLIIFALALPVTVHAAPPSAPDVRFQVYSETAIELFWSTPSSNSLVVGYEVSRDGALLGVFDALSYFDNSLETGIEYTYTVRAIDFNNEISSAVNVTLRTRSTETPEDRIAKLEQQIRDLQAQLVRPIPAPIPKTGQTDSIFAGDDGDQQSGVELPDPRFIVNVNSADDQNENGVCDNNELCNGSVTDQLTGLTWLQNASCFGSLSFGDSIAAANGLAGDGSSNCQLTDGTQPGDWRMPNIRELLSMIDYSQRLPDLAVPTGHPFIGIVGFEEEGGFPSSYWSSTSSSVGGGYTASMSVGWVGRSIYRLDYFAWPVRD